MNRKIFLNFEGKQNHEKYFVNVLCGIVMLAKYLKLNLLLRFRIINY